MLPGCYQTCLLPAVWYRNKAESFHAGVGEEANTNLWSWLQRPIVSIPECSLEEHLTDCFYWSCWHVSLSQLCSLSLQRVPAWARPNTLPAQKVLARSSFSEWKFFSELLVDVSCALPAVLWRTNAFLFVLQAMGYPYIFQGARNSVGSAGRHILKPFMDKIWAHKHLFSWTS